MERAPKTFSEMAGTKDEDRARESPSYADKFEEASFKRLAILRMDVDGLGEVFRTFLGSLAHFSALSRQLDWFFKGYLNTLWNEGKWKAENFKDWTQIIYSGGDDLFLVGRWDCLLEFARVIQKEFRDWTCEHPQLGISGGLVFVTHKFPIIRAAELCDDAERFAKEHNFVANNGGQVIWSKNALTVFDHPLHWDHELPIVSVVKDELVKYANADLLPRGFIISLQNFHALKLQQNITPNESPTWRWQMAYQIARLLQRLEKRHGAKDREATMPTKLFEFLHELQTGIFIGQYKGQSLQSNYDFFDLIAIAARWAEYELRSLG
jgi:CRISPR-associated protein Csm1